MTEYIKKIEDNAKKFADDILDPKLAEKDKTPFYSSGARSLIRIGGREIVIAKNIRWNISYNATPISTIDSNFPWDIDIGTGIVRATISQFINPIKGLEADHLFNTMKASIHQPMVEMQVLDIKTGSAIFFSKGMFTEMSGDITLGAASSFSANFIGIQYQHFVSQNFKPYKGLASSISEFSKGLQNLAGDVSGGLF